jgi:hypothetical protein
MKFRAIYAAISVHGTPVFEVLWDEISFFNSLLKPCCRSYYFQRTLHYHWPTPGLGRLRSIVPVPWPAAFEPKWTPNGIPLDLKSTDAFAEESVSNRLVGGESAELGKNRIKCIDIVETQIPLMFCLVVGKSASHHVNAPSSPAVDFLGDVMKSICEIMRLLPVQITKINEGRCHEIANFFALLICW